MKTLVVLACASILGSTAFASNLQSGHVGPQSSWEEIEASRQYRFNYPSVAMPAGFVPANKLCMRDDETIEGLELYAEKCVAWKSTEYYGSECVKRETFKQVRSVFYDERVCSVGPSYNCQDYDWRVVKRRQPTSFMVDVYSTASWGYNNPAFSKKFTIRKCD